MSRQLVSKPALAPKERDILSKFCNGKGVCPGFEMCSKKLFPIPSLHESWL